MTIFNYSRIWKEEKEIIVGRDDLEYGVIEAKDGHRWLDRNIGATRVATAIDDNEAYGGYFQWGRELDGHSNHDSGTTSTQSSTDSPGHGNFILNDEDWRVTVNNNLWQGVEGINNVCPVGFRLPTETELSDMFDAEGITNIDTAFSSTLKIPASGYRFRSSGSLQQGTSAYVWTSTVLNNAARYGLITDSVSSLYGAKKSNGWSVRCIEDY